MRVEGQSVEGALDARRAIPDPDGASVSGASPEGGLPQRCASSAYFVERVTYARRGPGPVVVVARAQEELRLHPARGAGCTEDG